VEGIGFLRPDVDISLNDKASEMKILGVYSMLESVGLCMLKKLEGLMSSGLKNTLSISVSASDKVSCQNTAKSGSYHPVSWLESQESWTRSYRSNKH
jgi:hypothetical protein